MIYNPSKERVAAVCGNEVRVFDAVQQNGVRPLLYIRRLPNHGQARQWAIDHDDRIKASCSRAGVPG